MAEIALGLRKFRNSEKKGYALSYVKIIKHFVKISFSQKLLA